MNKLDKKGKELAEKLTNMQRRFVHELIKPKTSNRQAYLKAGGKSKTESAQDAAAHTMFSNVKVKAYYNYLMEQSAKDSVMTRTEALERLTLSARVKISDICEFDYVEVGKDENDNPIMQTVWTMKNAKDIDPDIAACIKSVTFTKTGPKIELYDANGAIKQLSEMQGWNSAKKHEVSGGLEVTKVVRKII